MQGDDKILSSFKKRLGHILTFKIHPSAAQPYFFINNWRTFHAKFNYRQNNVESSKFFKWIANLNETYLETATSG